MKTVKEVSELTGVSVRALHHYDATGLLKPAQVTKAGLSGDFSAYKQLSPADFAQVIILTLVHFLIKTGVLSALLIGIKKLRKWLKHK